MRAALRPAWIFALAAASSMACGESSRSPVATVQQAEHDHSKPFPRPEPRPLPDFPIDPLVPTEPLGYLPGTAGVSEGGDATYNIPLAVPPGVRGMQPNLSLAYSSRGGNGLLGVGWSLIGASQIERCHKTLRTEGVTAGYDFSEEDSYCLNGAKLVEVGSTPEGREYRTEASPFDRIIRKTSSNSFEVRSADGRISTYEPLALQREKVVDPNDDNDPYNDVNKLAPWRVTTEDDGEVVLMWPVARIEDRFGNAIQHHYEKQGGPFNLEAGTSIELASITYTHHPDDPNGATREVLLVYADRPAEDQYFTYASGIRLNHKRRLQRIEMHAPSKPGGVKELQWSYDLGYPTSTSAKTGRSQLTSVQQCDRSGACGWKKQFLWKGQGEPLAIQASYSSVSETDPVPWYHCEPPGIASNEVRPVVLDADGDGLQDVLLLHSYELAGCSPFIDTNEFKWKLLLSGAGYAPHTVSDTYYFDDDTGQLAPGRWRAVDVDNDGRDDLIAGIDEGDDSVSAHGGYFKYRCLTWHGASNSFGPCMLPETKDKSNAGMLDSRWHAGDRLRWPLWNFADFDGDGRVDLMENAYVRRNLGVVDGLATFVLTAQPTDLTDFDDAPNNEISWPWKTYNRGAEAFDVDGDGRAELLLSNPPGVDVEDLAGPNEPIGDGHLMVHALGILPSGDGIDRNIPGLSRGAVPWASQAEGDIVINQDTDFFSVSADVNGDGLKDQVIVRHTNSPSNGSLTWSGNDQLGGIGTFVQYNTGRGYTPARRTGMQFRPIEQWLHLGPLTSFDDGDYQYAVWNTSALSAAVDVVDVNNDGRDDIVVKSMETWIWRNQSELELLVMPDVYPPQETLGPDDNVNEGSTFWHTRIYLSTGNDFRLVENPFDPGLPTTDGDRGYVFTRPVQLDDDPEPEYITRGRAHPDSGSVPVNEWRGGLTSGALVRVDLDAGEDEVIWAVQDEGASDPKEIFTYRDARFPQDENGCNYPVSCPSRFPGLVDEHHSSQGRDRNGQVIYRRTKHRQNRPRVDLRGRGMLGFASRRTVDLDTGAETRVFYDELTTAVGDFFPYAGMATKVESLTPIFAAPNDGQPNLTAGNLRVRVSVTTRTPAHELLFGGAAYFAYPSDEIRQVYEKTMELEMVDGEPRLHEVSSPNMVLVSYVHSATQYDTFGNPKHVTTSVLDGETRETTSTYLNDTDSWLIGLPLSHATTSMTYTRETAYEYDSAGHLEEVHVQPNDVDPAVRSTAHSVRDERGLVIQVAEEAPGVPVRVTNLYYDVEKVFVAQTINAAGHESTVLRHPALGVPVLTEDLLGVKSFTKYDGFGRLYSTDGPTDLDIQAIYRKPFKNDAGDILGLRTTTHVADGSEQTIFTDEIGRAVHTVVSGFQGEMLHAATHYNLLGQVVTSTRMAKFAPSLLTTDVVYDTLGRPLVQSAPDGVETTFEYEPFETRTFDAEGHERKIVHDAHHRPAYSEEEIVEDGQVKVLKTTFSYDAFDLVKDTTDPAGHQITIRHDVLGRKIRIQDPDGGATDFGYNGLGELKRKITPTGDVLTASYDDLGRPESADSPDGTTLYEWDTSPNGLGQIAAALSPDGVIVAHGYDSLGRPEKSWTVLAQVGTFEMEQRYDDFGHLAEITYPSDPSGKRFKVQFEHNSYGFAKSVSRSNLAPEGQPQTEPVWQTLERDDNLALTRGTFGNGIMLELEREPATGMAWQISAKPALPAGSPVTFQVTYLYDALRNVDARTWSGTAFGNNTISETFVHDALDRLTDWQVAGPVAVDAGPRQYRYDTMGNLTNVKENGQSVYQATYGANQHPNALASSTLSSVFEYDAGGRQTKAGDRKVTYTPFDKPRTVTVDGLPTDFRYGPSRERVEKVAPEGQTVYIGGLYERRTTAGEEQHVFFIPGETGIVAQVTRTQVGGGDVTEEIQYFVRDALGSASAAFDQNGNVEAQVFDPWGERIFHSGASDALTTDVHHGYTGQRREDDIGWIDMNARMYDPAQRRFTSADPLVADPLFSTGRNRFAYVLNNPLRYTDPSGMGVEETIDSTPVSSPTTRAGVLHLPQVSISGRAPTGDYTWPVADPPPTTDTPVAVAPRSQPADGASSTEVRREGGLTRVLAFVARGHLAKQGLEQGGVDMIVNSGITLGAMGLWATDPSMAEGMGVDPISGIVSGVLDAPVLTGNRAADILLHQVPIVRIGQGVYNSGRLWMEGDPYASGYAMAAPQGEVAMIALGALAGSAGSGGQTVRGFHGTKGNNVLGILESNAFLPRNGKVFLSETLGDTFVHGVDSSRRAALSIEVEVAVGEARVSRIVTAGNPHAILIESGDSVPATIHRMFVRTPNSEGGFSTQVIEGTDAIRVFLSR